MSNYDETLDNIIKAIGKISETNIQKIERINLDAIEQAINAANTITTSTYNLSSVFDSILKTLIAHYEQIDAISAFSTSIVSEMAELQTSIAIAASLYESSMIENIAKCISALNINGCISSIQETINKPSIIMPDYSFLKTSPLMKGVQKDIVMPYGFVTDIKNFNVSSAKQLASNTSIVFNSKERAFVSENNKVTINEINTICTAVKLFETINNDDEMFSENELINFMSFLDQTPKLALNNPVGKRINQVIKDYRDCIEFDKDYFYHSRPRKKSEPPFVWGQMLKAPYGLSSIGRFNDVGQARFYFSDTKEGSVEEIRKHVKKEDGKEYTIQTVMISARNPVKIIDLSSKEMRGLNTFLKYIRIPYNDKSGNRPREYLIPQFVADCCFSCGIDGIKYYGGKAYSNYVTWSDGFFSFVSNLGDSEV